MTSPPSSGLDHLNLSSPDRFEIWRLSFLEQRLSMSGTYASHAAVRSEALAGSLNSPLVEHRSRRAL
jgi:hypothetical protein